MTTEPKTLIICEELDVDSGWLFTICTEVSDCMITNLVGQHKYQKLPNLFCFLCVDHLKWEFSMSRKHEISLYVFWFVSVFCNKILLMVLNICTCKTAQTIWYFWPTLKYENPTFVMNTKTWKEITVFYYYLSISCEFRWLYKVLFAYLFWLEASTPEFLISAVCITRSKWTPPIKYTLLLLMRYKLIWNLDYNQLQHIINSFCVLERRKKYKQTRQAHETFCVQIWSSWNTQLPWCQIPCS